MKLGQNVVSFFLIGTVLLVVLLTPATTAQDSVTNPGCDSAMVQVCGLCSRWTNHITVRDCCGSTTIRDTCVLALIRYAEAESDATMDTATKELESKNGVEEKPKRSKYFLGKREKYFLGKRSINLSPVANEQSMQQSNVKSRNKRSANRDFTAPADEAETRIQQGRVNKHAADHSQNDAGHEKYINSVDTPGFVSADNQLRVGPGTRTMMHAGLRGTWRFGNVPAQRGNPQRRNKYFLGKRHGD